MSADMHLRFPPIDASMISTTQIGGTHYTSKTIQPWDAMQSWMTREQFIGYLHGNAIKYVARYQDKGGVEDLYKAIHHLQKLANTLQLNNQEQPHEL